MTQNDILGAMSIASSGQNKILRNDAEILDVIKNAGLPRIGRWTHDGSHWKNRFICSECGYKLIDEPTNYCPNCGAKMTEIPTGCSTCILDNTDACIRGAGRAVDDEACENYLGRKVRDEE